MAEHMRGDMQADAGKFCIAVYLKSDGLVGKLVSEPVDKEVPAGVNVFLKYVLEQKLSTEEPTSPYHIFLYPSNYSSICDQYFLKTTNFHQVWFDIMTIFFLIHK